jgi:competence protein ComEA
MKRNLIIFVSVCLAILGFTVFDFLSFDGEIELETTFQEDMPIRVYIAGEVLNPGVYSIDSEDRLEDLVAIAGGVTDQANMQTINLAMKLEDGDKAIIPTLVEGEVLQNKDLNTMTKDDFIVIDTIGEVTASRIVDYRNRKGFMVLEDLLEVEGIGEQKMAVIKNYLEN